MQMTEEERRRVPREPSMLQSRVEPVGIAGVDAVGADANRAVDAHEAAQRKVAELKAQLNSARSAERAYAAGRGPAPVGRDGGRLVEQLEREHAQAEREVKPLEVERRARYSAWQRLIALHRPEIERRRWEECLAEAEQIVAPIGAMIEAVQRLRVARAKTNVEQIVLGRGHKISGGGKAITVAILGREVGAVEALEAIADSFAAIAAEAAAAIFVLGEPQEPQEPLGRRRRSPRAVFPPQGTREVTLQ